MPIDNRVEAQLMRSKRLLVFLGGGFELDPLWANADAFFQSPQQAYWKYQELLKKNRRIGPNAVHLMIQRLEKRVETLVVSLNIDGVDSQALGKETVVNLYGDLTMGKCTEWECMFVGKYQLECPQCGGNLRPAVVWQGESFSLLDLDRIDDFILDGVDTVISIGVDIKSWPINGLMPGI